MVLSGIGLMVASVVGWLVTVVGASLAAQPDVVEDLTAVWAASGLTPLGGTETVSVPPQQTLVGFLVGTDLRGSAGTTTGTCTATTGGRPVALDWPVLLDFSVTGLLTGEREAVAVAGWRNTEDTTVTVDISCVTMDSTVDGFVALASRTAEIPRDPWFQPWVWVGFGALGTALAAAGVIRLRRD